MLVNLTEKALRENNSLYNKLVHVFEHDIFEATDLASIDEIRKYRLKKLEFRQPVAYVIMRNILIKESTLVDPSATGIMDVEFQLSDRTESRDAKWSTDANTYWFVRHRLQFNAFNYMPIPEIKLLYRICGENSYLFVKHFSIDTKIPEKGILERISKWIPNYDLKPGLEF